MKTTRNHNYWTHAFPETMGAIAALMERLEDKNGDTPNHWDDEEASYAAANYADDLTQGDISPDADKVFATIIDHMIAPEATK